jgi:two-component system sensor histidine kinase KdpD
MKNTRFSSTLKLLSKCLLAMLTVAAVTVPLSLIGRAPLGEGVIALVYLLPVTWSANRWGLLPGISAALTATLCFDFLFIPPFYTFTVGSLEGWLILAIFLGVAIVMVEYIQASLSKAREATLMYEFSVALSSQRTQEAIAYTVAREIQQLFQATLVNVIYWSEEPSSNIVVSQPGNVEGKGKPDRILPILTSWGLIGEIQIWRGPYMELPPEDSRLLHNFALQAARALERAQPLEAEQHLKSLASKVPAK